MNMLLIAISIALAPSLQQRDASGGSVVTRTDGVLQQGINYMIQRNERSTHFIVQNSVQVIADKTTQFVTVYVIDEKTWKILPSGCSYFGSEIVTPGAEGSMRKVSSKVFELINNQATLQETLMLLPMTVRETMWQGASRWSIENLGDEYKITIFPNLQGSYTPGNDSWFPYDTPSCVFRVKRGSISVSGAPVR